MSSEVVRLSLTHNIAWVTMEDRSQKNMFSPAILKGLRKIFDAISGAEDIRVVILQGYDSYFCCGGTSQELMAIHESQYDFTALGIHDLLLACPVPVIAAMQGHALGGGFVFGCFADIILLEKRAYYATNFMNFGFTPGFGSTLIIPHLFGSLMAHEMLYSGRQYSGHEIGERVAGICVLERNVLLEKAHDIAQEIAEKPRISLVTLKAHMTRSVRAALPQTVAHELAMHKTTFHRSEVRERISSYLWSGVCSS